MLTALRRSQHGWRLSSARMASTFDYDFTNLVEMQESSCRVNEDRNLFGTKKGKAFEWMTFGEFGQQVDKCRSVLAAHNVGIGDNISIISNNRVEWAIGMYAANGLGARVVPMYEAQSERDWKYIINDSDSKMVLVATEKIFEKTESYINTVGNVESVLCFDGGNEYMHSFHKWMAMATPESIPPALLPRREDISTIIYTSGTTGNPKGVILTHHNIVSNLYGLKKRIAHKADKSNISLCILPWSHVFGLTCELHAFIAQGSAMALCPNKDEILESLAIIKPTLMLSVPALLNRVYDGVHMKVKAAPAMRQKLFHTAFRVARERNHKLEYGHAVSSWLDLKHKFFDKWVYSKLRDVMGGRLEYIGSGGAAANPTVLQFFEDMGIPVLEGYGLTETSPVISATGLNWSERRLGCAGVPLYNVTCKIFDPESGEEMPSGEEGEICVAGDSIMEGYRNNNEATKEVFIHINGKKFFRTGDLGRIVDCKFLKITGRIKELYKLENGKYVTPVPLEDSICRSQFVAQALVYGSDKKFNTALIVPDFVQLNGWAVKNRVVIGDLSTVDGRVNLMNHDKIINLLNAELVAVCGPMKHYERIRRWTPISEAFSQENNLLTPKMSLRRNQIVKQYEDVIDDMYTLNSTSHEIFH